MTPKQSTPNLITPELGHLNALKIHGTLLRLVFYLLATT